MKKYIWDNSLSLVFLFLFLISMAGQYITGHDQYNQELLQEGSSPIPLAEYATSGHFIQSTFENWESEFLQMALFVWFTIFLYQRGSSESKKFDGTDAVDRKPNPKKKDAPGPVKRGGAALKIYQHSLTLVLLLLFAVSTWLHFRGSLADENKILALRGETVKTAWEYMGGSRFWFESFQNWQSEFLSIVAIVVLSIYLRQKGSPQSKPVDAPYDETGE